MAQDKLKETIDKIWPPTKRELKKMITQTKKIISEGEKYLKDVSHESAENVRQLSLKLKREKAYYELGKATANMRKDAWASDKKIDGLVEGIKKLDREIIRFK